MTVGVQHAEPKGLAAAGMLARFNVTVCGVLFVFVYLFCVDVAYVVGVSAAAGLSKLVELIVL